MKANLPKSYEWINKITLEGVPKNNNINPKSNQECSN